LSGDSWEILDAGVHAGTVVIGEKLGLCKALGAQPITSAELASKTLHGEADLCHPYRP
jgi:hypothetical protein